MLDHLEGRLGKVTAVIQQVAVQGKALELVMPEEGADRADQETPQKNSRPQHSRVAQESTG